MTWDDKAAEFRNLHTQSAPLVLFNAWDAGSAKTIAKAGAKAIATGSWSVAAAQGYDDGEDCPLELVLGIVQRIVESVEVPVSADFEGGYAEAPEEVAAHVLQLLQTGVVGLNFEDRVVSGRGLYSIPDQTARIRAIRNACDAEGKDVFLNARTDLFFGGVRDVAQEDLVQMAIERGQAYHEAGASGLFVPGLLDPAALAQIAEAVPLPLNAMAGSAAAPEADLLGSGIARLSYGPFPYMAVMKSLGGMAQI
jgi:2-methylisocitrate lyase-like PEP mutase family enzyme